MSSAADRNSFRLQGALHRVATALRRSRETLFSTVHVLTGADDDTIRQMPTIVAIDKVLGKPIGDVTRHELIAMWMSPDDMEALDALLRDLSDGNFRYEDYDETCRQIGALRKLLEG